MVTGQMQNSKKGFVTSGEYFVTARSNDENMGTVSMDKKMEFTKQEKMHSLQQLQRKDLRL